MRSRPDIRPGKWDYYNPPQLVLTSSAGHQQNMYCWQLGGMHPTAMLSCYRPQTKFAKVMFLQVSVILSTGGHVWLLWGVCGCSGGVCGCSWEGMHGCSRGACVVAPGGVCVVAPGGHGSLLLGGHAWLLWGGMHGYSRGACMVFRGGCVLFLGGHAWFFRGACVVFSMRYGQWTGRTHPTGMHSCYVSFILLSFQKNGQLNYILHAGIKLGKVRYQIWHLIYFVLFCNDNKYTEIPVATIISWKELILMWAEEISPVVNASWRTLRPYFFRQCVWPKNV